MLMSRENEHGRQIVSLAPFIKQPKALMGAKTSSATIERIVCVLGAIKIMSFARSRTFIPCKIIIIII